MTAVTLPCRDYDETLDAVASDRADKAQVVTRRFRASGSSVAAVDRRSA